MKAIALAACLLVSAPAVAQTAPKPPAEANASQAGKKADQFDMARMMAMFDKMFPAQPDPAPERLALAQVTAGGVFPNGTYAGIFDEFMGGMVDRILAFSPGDLGPRDAKAKAGAPATLRESIVKTDPHFDERMKIMRRVIGEELVKVSAIMEPKMREGLARSIARRFDERQLREINTFLATDSGRAFAGQTMRMWIDPDVMRSMMQSFPHVIAAMPGAMLRIEAETAHLPKPKKGKTEAKKPAA